MTIGKIKKRRFAIAAVCVITSTMWDGKAEYDIVDEEGVARCTDDMKNEQVIEAYKEYADYGKGILMSLKEETKKAGREYDEHEYDYDKETTVRSFIQNLCTLVEERKSAKEAEEALELLFLIYEEGCGFGIKLVNNGDDTWDSINEIAFAALANNADAEKLDNCMNALLLADEPWWVGLDSAGDYNSEMKKWATGVRVGGGILGHLDQERRKAWKELIYQTRAADEAKMRKMLLDSRRSGYSKDVDADGYGDVDADKYLFEDSADEVIHNGEGGAKKVYNGEDERADTVAEIYTLMGKGKVDAARKVLISLLESGELGTVEALEVLYNLMPDKRRGANNEEEMPRQRTNGFIKGCGRGMSNVGNTCYANASLQALLGTKALRDVIAEYKGGKVLWKALKSLLEEREKESTKGISMANRLEEMGNSWDALGRLLKTEWYRQQDAMDFIIELINGLGTWIGRESGKEQRNVDMATEIRNAMKEKVTVKMVNEACCPKCGKEKRTIGESNVALEVAFGENEEGEAINSKLMEELGKLSEVKYESTDLRKCGEKAESGEMCGGKIGESKETLQDLPEVLIIRLKKYRSDNNGGTKKIKNRMTYEEELTIPDCLLSKELKEENRTYTLRGVIKHRGESLVSGHYVANVRNEEDRKWYEYDDSNRTECNKDGSFAVEDGAYILVYQKKNEEEKDKKGSE
ncbi:MAG: ubiquitin carboxyl-terminal hydrolase [Holosporaceae bacterium]|jgi:ubiquitin C-terminal hydrolase|nr:ubiquitin carboxyl-terminal hydrolase [Holosporaceae bacterium]